MPGFGAILKPVTRHHPARLVHSMQRSLAKFRKPTTAYLRHHLTFDVAAGITGATAGAPQAMGFALVAGISPVYGLYTAIVTTIIGGLTSRSTFMTTGPTNALAVVLGSTLAPFTDSGDLVSRLVTLTFLAGVIQIILGLIRAGGLTRYVSGAVMTGFVTGAASLVVLGQLEHLTGIDTPRERVIPFYLWNLVQAIGDLNPETFLMGGIALAIIVYLHHTRLSPFATLIAIIVTSLLIWGLNWDSHGVQLVRDMSSIPNTLPAITLPEPGLVPDLLTSALAIAILGLVQTIALTQTIPEPRDHKPDPSQEFVSQGLSNLGGSFFQNMPASGSLSRTAINLKAGAHTRLANVWAGAFVGLTMLLAAGLAERIALAALAAHLIVAGTSLIDRARIRWVWLAGWASRWAMVATFVSTWVLPLQYSVYVGMLLSLGLYVYQSSRLKLTALEPVGDHTFREIPAPKTLPDHSPVILSVQGNLFFAAMSQLSDQLPDPNSANCPVVILRLRGDTLLAGTGASVLVDYANRLRARGGNLILCGVEKETMATLARTGALYKLGPQNVFPADDILLASTHSALYYARDWLDKHPE